MGTCRRRFAACFLSDHQLFNEIVTSIFKNIFSVIALLGRLSNYDGDGYEASLKKCIRSASNFISLVPSRLIRQMFVNFLELNSKGLYESSRK